MTADYYNKLYSKNKQYFGDYPENLLRDYFSLCDRKGRVLDIGIGQGRNTRFMLHQGYGVDGIDISDVAINNLKSYVESENLDLRLYNQGFENFTCPKRYYSAILIFGLFSVLSIRQIEDLARKSRQWIKKDGLIFLTGFTPHETYFKPKSAEWKKITAESYTDGKGNYRTFMDMHDAIAKFRRFKTIYQWEGYGEMHTHGTDQIEQHHMFEIILQKK
jgi:cyclopropane fatty-acyl-phospholipid synthase-like methyltransferase